MMQSKGILAALMMVIGMGLVVSCQNVPLEPASDTVQILPATQKFIGLAKADDDGVLLHSRKVNEHNGGRVGGSNTGDSYIEIPPQTLQEDLDLTFAIYADESTQAFVFDISACKRKDFTIGPHKDHIEFQEGQTAKLVISKELVGGDPNAVVNFDDQDEQYAVIQEEDGHWVWIIELPHFSRYAWAWID